MPAAAQFAADRGMVDAGAEGMTHRTPNRSCNRYPTVQRADRRRKHGKAVDAICGAVDRIDCPYAILAAAGTLLHFLADDVMAREAFCKPRPDQGLDTVVDLGDGVTQAAQRTRRAGFLAHGNAAIGRRDFGACERGKLDRHALDIVEILENVCIRRRQRLYCFIYHWRSSARLDAAPAPEFARVQGRTTK